MVDQGKKKQISHMTGHNESPPPKQLNPNGLGFTKLYKVYANLNS